MKMRLQKFIAQAGVASRRKAEELILASQILVNGKIVNKLGTQIDSEKDVICLGKQKIEIEETIIYAFNKPTGVTSTTQDEHAEKVIIDYLPRKERIYPVGRLDKDSEGLILLTNNGELANKLTHPRYEHEKEYILEIAGRNDGGLNKFGNKFELDGETIQPMKVDKIKKLTDTSWTMNLVLKEGKKRQIRRIAEKLGYEVKKLHRIRIGKLRLGDLELGKWKIIKETDIL